MSFIEFWLLASFCFFSLAEVDIGISGSKMPSAISRRTSSCVIDDVERVKKKQVMVKETL